MGLNATRIAAPSSVRDDADVAPARWRLTGLDADGKPLPTISVTEEPIRIGRHPRTDYVLSSSIVSKEHAEILAVGPTVFVRDLDSRNGTHVNGRKISSFTPIGPDDHVRVGDVQFRIRDDRPQAAGETSLSLTQTSLSLDHWLADSFHVLITEGKLRIAFQPIVDTESQKTFGFEALARCQIAGIDSPSDLFALASRLNMSRELSHLCRVVAATEALRLTRPLPIFLNTSREEILNEDLITSLRTLRDMFPELSVVVEVNEECITVPKDVVRFHEQLKDLSYGLAFDDFGTGQSRIRELMQILPDYVKFDHSVIHNLHAGSRHEQSLIQSFVSLFRHHGVKTIAESVECEACLECCHEAGFEYCQGFYTGVPSPIEEWLPLDGNRRDTIQEMSALDE